MWTYTYTDELYHFGVLGMKWGVHSRRSGYTSKKYRTDNDYKELGKKRLSKRLSIINDEIDRTSASAFDQYKADKIEKNAKYTKKIANDITNDDKRLKDFGERTHKGQVATAATSVSALGIAATAAGIAFVASNPILVVPAAGSAMVSAGAAYINHLYQK